MAGSHDYRGRAKRCEALAEGTLHPESREILLKLAARWRSLAEADEDRAGHVATPEPSAPPQTTPDLQL